MKHEEPLKLVSIDSSGRVSWETSHIPDYYPLNITAKEMYGWAGAVAPTLGAPLSYAYCALLTTLAGIGVKSSQGVDVLPTLMTILVGRPGVGKSRTKSRVVKALAAMGVDTFGTIRNTTLASDRGLVKLFEDFSSPVACTVYQDEMLATLRRMTLDGSTLSQKINELWNSTTISVVDKKGIVEANVIFSLLGNLTVRDAEEFQNEFGADSQKGFFSRLIIVPGPDRWEWDDEWEPTKIDFPLLNADPLESAKDRERSAFTRPGGATKAIKPLSSCPRIPSHCFATLKAWRKAAPEGIDRGRTGEIVLRVALITAAANNDHEITEEGMRAAIAFGEWQEQVRDAYMPGEALTTDAIISNAIVKAFRDMHEISEEEQFKFSAILRSKSWYRKWGATACSRAKRALIEDGVLVEETVYDERSDSFKTVRGGRLQLAAEFRKAAKA